MEISLATRMDSASGVGETDPLALIRGAAVAIAQSARDQMGAQGVLVLAAGFDGGEECLASVGEMAPTARPPTPSFLLAKRAVPGGLELRHGADGAWLILTTTARGQAPVLTLAAHFDGEPRAVDRFDVIQANLQALELIVELRRESIRRLAGYRSALDRSDIGIVILGKDGAVMFANRAADTLLQGGEYLRRKEGGISARDLGDAIRLQVAIEHVCHVSTDAIEDPVVAIKRRHPLRPLLVCVSPAANDRDQDCEAGAVLRIIDPDQEIQPFLEPVCAHYRLSPVESRLACQLARGTTIEAAAGILRIKTQTARSYLKQIFLKTDTNRQPELVRMLLASTVRARPAGRFRIV